MRDSGVPLVLYRLHASRFGSCSGACLFGGSDWSPPLRTGKITPPSAFILES